MATITQQQPPLTETYELNDSTKQPPVVEPPSEPVNEKIGRAALLKLIAAGFAFFVSGVNDGSVGPLLPYMIRDYNISTAVVSIIYGANFLGWFLAALTNTHLREIFDLGGLLAFGAFFQLVAHALRVWKPPFPFFAVTFWLVCLGQAYQDAGCNAYVASVKAAHRWLALIHALYMAGCLVAPFVATPIASAGQTSRWYLFYSFPLGICVLNLALACFAFRNTIRFGRKRRNGRDLSSISEAEQRTVEEEQKKTPRQLMNMALSTKALWAISLFFFFFLGASITASGWIVQYLVEIRNGNIGQMGYVPAGFNGGAMLGRLVLAEPTYRLGERRMVLVYVVLCIAFQLVFWLVPDIIAASVAISFFGFFSGPFFATVSKPKIKGFALYLEDCD
ncbi:Bypass of stop codon protein 6 [Colletotrichum sidae]|uniref:Bypass of stop codon protein 6 n=1 Tax=Colletotrichum sidae TaxID=1347389 RepID=A0A4R8T1Y4_9PEZI|nr:Bypass of stop codon protein 6 [Colletotrichum sidae]